MRKDDLLKLMRSKNTVFNIKDISLIWNESNADFIRKKIFRYLKSEKLYSIRKGIYSKDKDYNEYELATKIYTPAYISFETVLARAGIVFQYYGQIFVASYLSMEIAINGQKYCFKKLKDSILTNMTGIEKQDNYFIASPERAFLDVVYLSKEYYFDNLSNVNWNNVFEILPLYHNKRMEKNIKRYRETTLKDLS